MQTYMNKRKTPDRAVPPVQEAAPSRSEMLHLSGAGAPQPMSPQLREKFEPGFGADFSNIRISRGHIPEEMGVEAVAQGTDILLDERAGMDVLGHELAHVVQQAQGRVEGGFPVVENAALEHEADVMGARVASGLTAEAGPQNGFGGETMSIAPMSSASAPAQCKSREDKAREKMKISQPTVLQPGTAAYKNSALTGKELDRARKSTTTAHGVATTQMINSMQDPAFMQRVMAHTGSSEEQIHSDMGKMVGEDYASQVLELDPHGQDMTARDDAMFRENHMAHLNWGKFLQGEMKGAVGPAIAAAKGSAMTEVEDRGKTEILLDSAMVDAQIASLSSAATSSTPTMSAVDGFLRGMHKGGSDMGGQHLEELISNEVFLRGVTPSFTDAAVRHSGDDQKKLKAMGAMFQRKVNSSQINLVPGRMAQVASAPAAAAAPAAPTQEEALPEGMEISDPVYEEVEEEARENPVETMMNRVAQGNFSSFIPRGQFDDVSDESGVLSAAKAMAVADAASPSYMGMKGMFNEDKAAMEAFGPSYQGMREIFNEGRAAQEAATPSYQGMREMFNERKAASEAQMPNYTGVKEMLREPKPSKPAAELLPGEMQSMFSTVRDERRADRAADQASSGSSFTGNLLSMFCENRPKSLAEELGLPEAPIKQEYVEGLTEFDDFDEPVPQHSAVGRVPFASGNQPKGEELRQMNLSPEEENELMRGVQILDPADEIDPFASPASPQKKKRWWQFWK
jgi:hypothetical protein